MSPLPKPSLDRRKTVRRRVLPLPAALYAGLGFMLACAPVAATMYKWVDANGNTIYSDQPPPGSIKTEIIKPPPPPANPDAVKELHNATDEMKAREKKRSDDAKVVQKKVADDAKRQELCNSTLAQIRTLQREDLYRVDPKGERVYVDADTRRRETEIAQRFLQENCGN